MITVAIILVAVAVWVAAATYTVFLWCEREANERGRDQ